MTPLKNLFAAAMIVLFLSGCPSTRTSSYYVDHVSQETIRAILIADNQLYAIGDTFSYQFGDSESAQKFIPKVQSARRHKVLKSAEIYGFHVKEGKVDTTVQLDIANFQQYCKTEPLFNYECKHNLKKPYYDSFTGKVVQIQNRQDLLAKGALAYPLQAELRLWTLKTEEVPIDYKTAVKNVGILSMIAVYGAITYPFEALSGGTK